jgi:hypothetical protein
LLEKWGVKKVGTVRIDGTKVKANASKHHSLSWGYANTLEERLPSEIADVMNRAEEADCEQEDSGMKIPEEISIREKRLQGITEAKAKIAARAEERYALEKAQYDEKISKREEQNAISGKKRELKQLLAPTCGPKDRDQVNITDAESRIMKTGGGFDPCYNAQAAVDIHSMLIVMADITMHANDKKEMEPAIENMEKIPKNIAEMDTILADSGYHSAANMERCIEHKMAPLIAEKREKYHQSPTERCAEPLPLSENATAAERAAHRLKTQEGKRLYAKRKSTVEPVFGIIQQVMGFRRFNVTRGKKVKNAWDLVAICWNIKRLHKIKTSMT